MEWAISSFGWQHKSTRDTSSVLFSLTCTHTEHNTKAGSQVPHRAPTASICSLMKNGSAHE